MSRLKFTSATLLASLLASAAWAQTDSSGTATTGSDNAADTMSVQSPDWSEEVRGAFFSDDGETLRTSEELTSEWDSLSDEDKEQVRSDCEAAGMSAGTSGAASTGSSGSSTTTAGGSSTEADSDAGGASSGSVSAGGSSAGSSGNTAAGSTAGSSAAGAEGEITSANMTQICAFVETQQ